MRVLYFGTYQRDYPRNRQVISALRGAGVSVTEHHEPVWDGRADNWNAGASTLLRMAGAQARLVRRRPRLRPDAVVVGYPGHADVLAARVAARGAPVVLNPLVSVWETLVVDRGRFRPDSLAARALREIDRRAFRAADLVVADTAANAAFFADLAGLPAERVPHCFVGAEDRLFTPGWVPSEPALFVGKLIPLHGLETILDAARLLPHRPFRVVGSGQLERVMRDRPDNVEHVPWMAYETLPGAYRSASCALGVFDDGPKAARVIPNKVFQALACGAPVVTADTPAARELLVDGESALLVRPRDAGGLADALERLARPELARKVAEGGRRAYEAAASEDVLGARWRGLLGAR